MSAPDAAGNLATQSGGSRPPELHQQLGGAQYYTPFQMGATASEGSTIAEGADETLAPVQPISLAGPEVSEDEGDGGFGSGSGSGGKKKKQRSMAELIKGLDLNMGDDGGVGEEGFDGADAENETDTAAADVPAAAAAAATPDKSMRKRKKAGEGDDDGDDDGDGEAKGFPTCPAATASDQQTAILSDGGGSFGRRERKKSKYLSPPYTIVIEKKPSFSARSAFGEVLDAESPGGISSPLARCGSFGRRRKEELDLEPGPFVFDEAAPSIAELLAELKFTAVRVMYLVSRRHASAVRGCFALFRTYSYLGSTESHGGGNKAPPPAPTGTPLQETKPSVAAAAEVSHLQQDNGADTHNITMTPVALAEKNASKEGDKSSAFGKRSNNKGKSATPVVAIATEDKSGVEGPKPRGRPKKNKEKEENGKAVDATLTMMVGLSPVSNSPAGTGNNPPPAPAPATVNSTLTSAPDLAAAESQLQANGNSSASFVHEHQPEQNEAKKKKRKKRSGPPGSASLIVTFAPGADLPTKDHLLGFFRKYGALDEVRTEVRTATRVACVAYANKSDAQRAIASPDRDQAFAPGVATFRIKYARQVRQKEAGGGGAPVALGTAGVPMPTVAIIPRPSLEFVKRSLQDMIAVLEESRPAGGRGPAMATAGSLAETDPRDSLVDQMSNLLIKVNKLLADGASGTVGNGGVNAGVVTVSAAADSNTAAAAATVAGGSSTT